jgi:hypothetical protein
MVGKRIGRLGGIHVHRLSGESVNTPVYPKP